MFYCSTWISFTSVFFQQSVSVFSVYTSLQHALLLVAWLQFKQTACRNIKCWRNNLFQRTFLLLPFSRAHLTFASITLRSILFSLEQWYPPIYRSFVLRNTAEILSRIFLYTFINALQELAALSRLLRNVRRKFSTFLYYMAPHPTDLKDSCNISCARLWTPSGLRPHCNSLTISSRFCYISSCTCY